MKNDMLLFKTRNPRDLKVALARHIITDFYSLEDARAAEEEFERIFKNKGVPEKVEEQILLAGTWKLPLLLNLTELTPSISEARRLIEQGGIRIDGERCTRVNVDVTLHAGQSVLIQVGKRRFLRVRAV
jgi:tyrosyl-tRNA synthetase